MEKEYSLSAGGRGRVLPILALLTALAAQLLLTTALAAETVSEERPPVTITVVEEIEAMEIEDLEVPLAAMPDSPARTGVKHIAWMSLVLAAVLFYVFYFSRYEKRLFQLRRAAANAEYEAMARRRAAKQREAFRE